MKKLILVLILGFILFCPEQTYAVYLDPLDEVRLIPSTSWFTPVISFLTIPIVYLIFLGFKNLAIVIWNGDKNKSGEESESIELTKKQAKNKMMVGFINRIFEALIFVGITIILLMMNFYYDIVYMKWYYIEDDIAAIGWFATPIWIVFQDFIILGFKKGSIWYKENSKL